MDRLRRLIGKPAQPQGRQQTSEQAAMRKEMEKAEREKFLRELQERKNPKPEPPRAPLPPLPEERRLAPGEYRVKTYSDKFPPLGGRYKITREEGPYYVFKRISSMDGLEPDKGSPPVYVPAKYIGDEIDTIPDYDFTKGGSRTRKQTRTRRKTIRRHR